MTSLSYQKRKRSDDATNSKKVPGDFSLLRFLNSLLMQILFKNFVKKNKLTDRNVLVYLVFSLICFF